MEGYWTQMVPWAKRFSFVVWGVTALMVYSTGNALIDAFNEQPIYQFGSFLAALLCHSPMIALGYFLFDFSRKLEIALLALDQNALERAYLSLHRATLVGVLIAVLMLLTSLYQIYLYSRYYWFSGDNLETY